MSETTQFHFFGGRPCLDLTATLRRRTTDRLEQLDSPEALGRWTLEAGLAARRADVDAALLHDAVTLREAIHRAVDRSRAGNTPEPSDIRIINRMAAGCFAPAQLDDSGRSLRPPVDATAETSLTAVALDAVDLLASQVERVKECADDRCTRLFLDSSHRQGRRWCDMGRCGNDNKKATFRARRRAATEKG
jgi:predicted RNA-binding Zn ribbon-like protein